MRRASRGSAAGVTKAGTPKQNRRRKSVSFGVATTTTFDADASPSPEQEVLPPKRRRNSFGSPNDARRSSIPFLPAVNESGDSSAAEVSATMSPAASNSSVGDTTRMLLGSDQTNSSNVFDMLEDGDGSINLGSAKKKSPLPRRSPRLMKQRASLDAGGPPPGDDTAVLLDFPTPSLDASMYEGEIIVIFVHSHSRHL